MPPRPLQSRCSTCEYLTQPRHVTCECRQLRQPVLWQQHRPPQCPLQEHDTNSWAADCAAAARLQTWAAPCSGLMHVHFVMLSFSPSMGAWMA